MEQIRSVVQPITKNLPGPVRELGLTLLGGKCYQRIVLDVDLTDIECLKHSISKVLGTGIVGVAAIVKLPQLFNLIASESAEGVSFTSYLLETIAYVITLVYNARMGNPFSTYGEVGFILVQNVAIACLVLNYNKQPGEMAIFLFGLVLGLWTISQSDIVHIDKLSMLQAGAGVLGIASKIPQIYTIWSEGTTGQLSAFAVFNFLIGSLARIFTTYQEVNDQVLLYGYIAGFALNLVLAIQMVYYWRTPSKTQRKVPVIRIENEKREPVAFSSGVEKTKSSKTPSTRRRA